MTGSLSQSQPFPLSPLGGRDVVPSVDRTGLISGFIASKIVNKSGAGAVMDIVLGIVGAVVGGWLFHTVGHVGVTGLNLYSILVALVGAIVVLILYHALFRVRAHG